jgi:hypothetical protein
MSELWVAVTAEYRGATFSHRAQGPDAPIARDRAVRIFDLTLDEAAWCVRSGLAGWLGPQTPMTRPDAPLSEYEKIAAIERIVDGPGTGFADDRFEKIKVVLSR